jgi:hypothetical protein
MIMHPESGWEDERRKKELEEREQEEQAEQELNDWVKGQLGFGS